MRAIHCMATLSAAAVLALAGCGGDDEETGGGGTTGGATQTQTDTATQRPEEAQSGDAKQVFASTCGGCHTLADAGTSGAVGPNLDDLEPSKDQVVQAIASGPGQMPENLLPEAEAEQVAEYVSSVAGS